MKQLKKKSILSSLLIFLLLAFLGSVALILSVPSLIKRLEGPADLASLNYDGELDDVYVSGTLEFIYDYYCETTKDANIVSREYIIDAGEKYYMGLFVPGSDLDDAENLLEASWAYMDGEDDGTMVYAAQYEIKGTIHKMPSDSLKYYNQFVSYLDSDVQATFLPYYLKLNEVGDMAGESIGFFVIGIVFWAIALVVIILPLSGYHQKQVKQYIAASSSPDMTRERVEQFLENTKDNKGLRYDNQFICGQSGVRTIFQDITKLVWVYQKTITHKRNFITVGHSYYLVLGFVDGKRYEITMKNEANVIQYIQELSAHFPNLVAGYSDELDKMFRKDLSAFLKLKYYSAEQA